LRGELDRKLDALRTNVDRTTNPAIKATATFDRNPVRRGGSSIGNTPTPTPKPEATSKPENKSTGILGRLKTWFDKIFTSDNKTTTSTPTVETMLLSTDKPTKMPRMTQPPTPTPTPMPTPKPTANVGMIGELVNNGRKNKDSYYLNYSQEKGNRDDCSTQVFEFYAIKGDKSPFLGIDKESCQKYYEVFHTPSNYFINSGGTIQTTVPRDIAKGVDPVPANWQETTQFGDMVIWKDKPTYDKDGRLIKHDGDAWHIGLCSGNGQMIDRGQWEEKNPNGYEEGLFVRGLDTIKSSYKLIMIIKPSDEARLTPDEIYEYLQNQTK